MIVEPQGREINILTNGLSADDHWCYPAGYSLSWHTRSSPASLLTQQAWKNTVGESGKVLRCKTSTFVLHIKHIQTRSYNGSNWRLIFYQKCNV